MSAYRYIVFPAGKQPTAEEVAELEGYGSLLEKRVAFGLEKKSQSLTIAFDADVFERAINQNLGFESLIQRWKLRGCELHDHLAFVKDTSALQPTTVKPLYSNSQSTSPRPVSSDKRLSAKELAAKEALAQSRLSVQRTIQRHATLQRAAAWGPYIMIGLGTLVIIAAGLYTGNRMLQAEKERRKETIERIASDPLREPLTEQPKKSEPVEKPSDPETEATP